MERKNVERKNFEKKTTLKYFEKLLELLDRKNGVLVVQDGSRRAEKWVKFENDIVDLKVFEEYLEGKNSIRGFLVPVNKLFNPVGEEWNEMNVLQIRNWDKDYGLVYAYDFDFPMTLDLYNTLKERISILVSEKKVRKAEIFESASGNGKTHIYLELESKYVRAVKEYIDKKFKGAPVLKRVKVLFDSLKQDKINTFVFLVSGIDVEKIKGDSETVLNSICNNVIVSIPEGGKFDKVKPLQWFVWAEGVPVKEKNYGVSRKVLEIEASVEGAPVVVYEDGEFVSKCTQNLALPRGILTLCSAIKGRKANRENVSELKYDFNNQIINGQSVVKKEEKPKSVKTKNAKVEYKLDEFWKEFDKRLDKIFEIYSDEKAIEAAASFVFARALENMLHYFERKVEFEKEKMEEKGESKLENRYTKLIFPFLSVMFLIEQRFAKKFGKYFNYEIIKSIEARAVERYAEIIRENGLDYEGENGKTKTEELFTHFEKGYTKANERYLRYSDILRKEILSALNTNHRAYKMFVIAYAKQQNKKLGIKELVKLVFKKLGRATFFKYIKNAIEFLKNPFSFISERANPVLQKLFQFLNIAKEKVEQKIEKAVDTAFKKFEEIFNNEKQFEEFVEKNREYFDPLDEPDVRDEIEPRKFFNRVFKPLFLDPVLKIHSMDRFMDKWLIEYAYRIFEKLYISIGAPKRMYERLVWCGIIFEL